MRGPYETDEHHIFIYGQSSADGWACRKGGCLWQGSITWDRATAQEEHDRAVGVWK